MKKRMIGLTALAATTLSGCEGYNRVSIGCDGPVAAAHMERENRLENIFTLVVTQKNGREDRYKLDKQQRLEWGEGEVLMGENAIWTACRTGQPNDARWKRVRTISPDGSADRPVSP